MTRSVSDWLRGPKSTPTWRGDSLPNCRGLGLCAVATAKVLNIFGCGSALFLETVQEAVGH
mgnify:CR=1 FL=1